MSITIGTLNDEEIIKHGKKRELIQKNFEADNVKQACYELRASNIYYDLSNNEKRYELNSHEYILLKPKQLIVIITTEIIYSFTTSRQKG